MLGENTVAKVDHGDGEVLRVHSMFYTIQGEGPQAGRPALFIRLSGCNLRCTFCDTEFDGGIEMPAHILFAEAYKILQKHHGDLVVITGGEPLLQNILPLVSYLNTVGTAVSVETAGTVFLPDMQHLFQRTVGMNLLVCSPKTPKIHPLLEHCIGAYKYVIAGGQIDPEDGLPNRSTQALDKEVRLHRRPAGLLPVPIYLQPMDEGDPVKNVANIALAASLCMKHHYRLSLQIHKIVGVA